MNAGDGGPTNQHDRFMRRCIELAHTAKSRGNTPVGSVVVMDGAIVGEGFEELPNGTNVAGHAEIIACQDAVDRTGNKKLEGATLYTTSEPCFMCSYVIRQCGISTVAYGLDTPIVGGITSPLPVLTDSRLTPWMPPPHVIPGVLRNECQALKGKQVGD